MHHLKILLTCKIWNSFLIKRFLIFFVNFDKSKKFGIIRHFNRHTETQKKIIRTLNKGFILKQSSILIRTIPNDVFGAIFGFLQLNDMYSVMNVCLHFYWRKFFNLNLNFLILLTIYGFNSWSRVSTKQNCLNFFFKLL